MAEPLSFEFFGAAESGRLRFWKLVCPGDFVALGAAATLDAVGPPDRRLYACVDEELTSKTRLVFYKKFVSLHFGRICARFVFC